LFLANNFIISVVLDYENHALGTQYAEIRDLENYTTEIAPCKTFVFLNRIREIIKANLIKGGRLENAIVVS
jgi:UDP-3-O-[3-hydroxymyristoyl] N-acetylglucosamine deacetylase/3-hydroxyacyl-[acyl-carrier-protein] dehydratase